MQNRNWSFPWVLRKEQNGYFQQSAYTSKAAFPCREAALPPLACWWWCPHYKRVVGVQEVQSESTPGFGTRLSTCSLPLCYFGHLFKLRWFLCFTQQPTDGSDTIFVLIKPKSCIRLRVLFGPHFLLMWSSSETVVLEETDLVLEELC